MVIGGTGNISSGVVAALLDRNHQVVLFNRGQRPDPPPPDVQVIHGDRRAREDFESKLRVEKFDAVIDMISFDADDAASSTICRNSQMGETRLVEAGGASYTT